MAFDEYDELNFLLPAVIRTLKSAGQLETYIKFNELLASNTLPSNNISYLLFLDLIEWFSADGKNTSRMRYNQILGSWYAIVSWEVHTLHVRVEKPRSST